jgi:predicted membrane-bound spermidine synthase
VLALAFIVLPLLLFRRRALEGRGRLRTLAAFAGLGLAYIVVEVGFIQRFNLYLGKPVVVFATVLGSLLVSSGLGSAFSRRFSRPDAPRWACLAAGGVALLLCFLAPPLVTATLEWPAAARVVLSSLLLAPCGFLMGMPFPLLMSRLEQGRRERIPWAWGVNGFASVVGTIGAVVLGMTAGYTAVLVAGVACYLATALAVGGGGWLASKNEVQ